MSVRRLALAAVLLCLFGPGSPALADCRRNEPGWLWNYEGRIGAEAARLTLVFSGEELRGEYVLSEALEDVALVGRIEEGRAIRLEVRDAAGAAFARIVADFPLLDPEGKFGDSELACEVVAGRWETLDGSRSEPLYFAMDGGTAGALGRRYAAAGVRDDERVHATARELRRALRSADWPAAMTLMTYPVSVALPQESRRYASAAELLAARERVFTPPFVRKIAASVPRNLFVRDEGVMLGSGEIWFGADGRVIAINNFLPDPDAPPRHPAEDEALRDGLPADVAAYIGRARACLHWGGEEPYDAERASQIRMEVERLGCARLDADEKTLRRRHLDDPQALRALRKARTP
ncbi:MAG: hypothetical protein ACKPE6_13975 [Gammaproteobacteria bacterium]